MGNFDIQRLNQIQALNPKLTDPDHIEVGQKLWLPRLLPVQPDTETRGLAPESRSAETTAVGIKVAETGTRYKSFGVTVEPNQTLQDIAVKYLGDFDLKRLHQIRALNPKMTDPDHIETGQKIWLPGRPPSASGKETLRLQPARGVFHEP